MTWVIATWTDTGDGRKIIFRYPEDLNPACDLASQLDRIMVVWGYKSESGQPSTEEHQRMTLLEDSLESIEDAGHFANLVLVSTGNCLREWTYYAKSGDEFLRRLNVALAEMPKFPIEIHIASDPTWSMYCQFKDWIRKRTTN